VLPFVDIQARYNNVVALLDSLKFTAGGRRYDIVALEGGATLRVGIVVSVASGGESPETSFLSSLGSNKAFTIMFESFEDRLTWTQNLDLNSLPELANDPELLQRQGSTSELLERLKNRRTLRLRVLNPFSIEITGRESWFTNGASFEYNYSGQWNRVPILDFDTISISADALRFGHVRVDSTNPPSQTVTITNAGSADFTISNVTVNNTAFSVDFGSQPVAVAPGSEFVIKVTYAPTSEGDVPANLVIITNGASRNIALSGTGVGQNDEEVADNRYSPTRQFLAELTLGQVILDVESDSSMGNPVPIFPEALLNDAIAAGVSNQQFEIRLPPIRRVESNQQATASTNAVTQLKASRGGDLTFLHTEGEHKTEIVCEVLTRPAPLPGEGQRLSFLYRQAQFLPAESLGPKKNDPCAFYTVYREEIPLEDIPELEAMESLKTINIAVSAHPKPPEDGYDTKDEENLVSVPVQVRISAVQPQIDIPGFQIFEVAYTSLPKLLDNRKVVQYKIKLDDFQLMKGMLPTIPANSELELYRAPEDGLRMLILEHMKLLIPLDPYNDMDFKKFVNLENDPHFDLQAFIDLEPNQDLETNQRYSNAFNTFNQMTAQQSYQAITTRLIQFWNHDKYNLKNAFQPIGKIPKPTVPEDKPHFIDELEGIAAGNIFYAVRAVRKGTSGCNSCSDLKLLPFRAAIPDTSPPTSPNVTKTARVKRGMKINWLPNREPDIYAYEVHRFTAVAQTSALRNRSLLQILYVDHTSARSGGQLVQRAPLLLKSVKKEILVRNQIIDLVFPVELYGLTGINDILALYLRNEDVPSYYESMRIEEFNGDTSNYWAKLSNPTLSADHRRIEGVALTTDAGDEVFVNGTKTWLVIRRDNENDLLELAFHTIEVEGVPVDLLADVDTLYLVGSTRNDNLMPTDQERVLWSQVNGHRGRTLRVKFEPETVAVVGKEAIAVRVAYGVSDDYLDDGMPYYEFIDSITADSDSVKYRVVAVRRVKTGVGDQDWKTIKSGLTERS
jgi:hypothetical protein